MMKTFLKYFFLTLTLMSLIASFLIDSFELQYDDGAFGGVTVFVMFVFGFIRQIARELLSLLSCSRPISCRTFYQIIYHTIWQYLGYIPNLSSYDFGGLPK